MRDGADAPAEVPEFAVELEPKRLRKDKLTHLRRGDQTKVRGSGTKLTDTNRETVRSYQRTDRAQISGPTDLKRNETGTEGDPKPYKRDHTKTCYMTAPDGIRSRNRNRNESENRLPFPGEP